MLYTTRWGLRIWLPVYVNRTAVIINAQENFLYVASGMEAAVIAASAVAIGTSVFALFRATIFNKNILLMMTAQLVDFSLSIISRMIFLRFMLFCSDTENSEIEDLLISTALFLKTYSICSSAMALTGLVMERFLATVYRMTYEKSKSVRIGCAIVSLKALLGFAFSCYSLFSKFRLYRLWIAVFLLNAAMFRMLSLLHKYNVRESDKLERDSLQYTLSIRFQLRENILVFKGHLDLVNDLPRKRKLAVQLLPTILSIFASVAIYAGVSAVLLICLHFVDRLSIPAQYLAIIYGVFSNRES